MTQTLQQLSAKIILNHIKSHSSINKLNINTPCKQILLNIKQVKKPYKPYFFIELLLLLFSFKTGFGFVLHILFVYLLAGCCSIVLGFIVCYLSHPILCIMLGLFLLIFNFV